MPELITRQGHEGHIDDEEYWNDAPENLNNDDNNAGDEDNNNNINEPNNSPKEGDDGDVTTSHADAPITLAANGEDSPVNAPVHGETNGVIVNDNQANGHVEEGEHDGDNNNDDNNNNNGATNVHGYANGFVNGYINGFTNGVNNSRSNNFNVIETVEDRNRRQAIWREAAFESWEQARMDVWRALVIFGAAAQNLANLHPATPYQVYFHGVLNQLLRDPAVEIESEVDPPARLPHPVDARPRWWATTRGVTLQEPVMRTWREEEWSTDHYSGLEEAASHNPVNGHGEDGEASHNPVNGHGEEVEAHNSVNGHGEEGAGATTGADVVVEEVIDASEP